MTKKFSNPNHFKEVMRLNRFMGLLSSIVLSLVLLPGRCSAVDIWATAYLPSWELNISGTDSNWGSYTPQEIDWDAFTHLILFATRIDSDGSGGCCSLGGNWKATRLNRITADGHAHGKPVLFSVGGFGSSGWYTTLSNTTSRQNLVNNLVSHMVTYRFDGIDIDIEEDSSWATYLDVFSQELRTKMNEHQAFYDNTKKPILTAAIMSAGSSWAQSAQYYDQINIMSYDMMGTWWGELWHNNAAKNVPGTMTDDDSGQCDVADWSETNGECMNTVQKKIDYYRGKGVPANKLGGGVDFNGHIWRGGANMAGNNGLLNPRERWSRTPEHWVNKASNATGECKSYVQESNTETRYYALRKCLFPTFSAEVFKYDSLSKVPYVSSDVANSTFDTYVTYQDVDAVKRVVDVVREKGIGGLIIWEIGGGYLGKVFYPPSEYPNLVRDELLQAVKQAVFGGVDTSSPPVTVSHSPSSPSTNQLVTISATANDPGGAGVQRIEIFVNSTSSEICTFSSPFPTSANCQTVGQTYPLGTHSYYAIAIDSASNPGQSLTQTFTVTEPDTQDPTVSSITNPANGSTVSGTVSVSASASDNVGVVGVQFKLDGANLGSEDTTAPYSTSWNTTQTSNGSHTLTAVARDAAGNTATSASIAVTVSNSVASYELVYSLFSDRSNPQALGGAALLENTTVYIFLTPETGVTKVSFYLDTVFVKNEFGAPWDFKGGALSAATPWKTGNAANHTIRAQVQAGSLLTVNADFVVRMPDTQDPTVSITNPANGSTVSGTVSVSASASDNEGVVGVQFKLDGANLGSEGTTAPYSTYSTSWNTISSLDGSHTLTAVARDAAGNSTTSTAVNITVDNAAPVISSVTASNIGQSSATITWTTNEPADSQAEYGTTISYGSWTTLDSSKVTSHSQVLTGLAASTLYHYRVKSTDAAGNLAISGDFTFTTASNPPPPPSSSNLLVYTDSLLSPWKDASWTATNNFLNTSPVFQGAKSIRTALGAWGALRLRHGAWGNPINIDPTKYKSLKFAIHGGSTGGKIKIILENDSGQVFSSSITVIKANVWKVIDIPMSQLNPSNYTIHSLTIQEYNGLSRTFYVDEIKFIF